MMFGATLVLSLWAGLAAAVEPACRSCHVFVLVLSGVRADALTPERMPRLAARAARAARFDAAFAPAPWSQSTIISMLTGALPSRHGLDGEPNYDGYAFNLIAISTDLVTLPRLLASAGWRTRAFIEHDGMEPDSGLFRGFEEARRQPSSLEGPFVAAARWSAVHADRPLFTVLITDHVYPRSRHPWAAQWSKLTELSFTGSLFGLAGEEKRQARAVYDGMLRETDAAADAYLSALDSYGLSSGAVVAVVGSNGLEFGEHGGFAAGSTLYDEVLSVPWFMSWPGLDARAVSAPVSLVDFAPTVLGVVGVEAPAEWRGRSLVAAASGGGGGGRDVVSETRYRGLVDLASLRAADGGKLILDRATGASAFFRTGEDPRETRDLASQRPDEARELRERLERALARGAP